MAIPAVEIVSVAVFVIQPSSLVQLSILVVIVFLGTDGDNDIVSSAPSAVEVILFRINGLLSGTHHTVISEIIIISVLRLEPSRLHIPLNSVKIIFFTVNGVKSLIADTRLRIEVVLLSSYGIPAGEH